MVLSKTGNELYKYCKTLFYITYFLRLASLETEYTKFISDLKSMLIKYIVLVPSLTDPITINLFILCK